MRHDYQRQKAYRAEWRGLDSFSKKSITDIAEVERLIAKLADRHGTSTPSAGAVTNLGGFAGMYYGFGHIEVILPCTKAIVMHEFAHHLARGEVQGGGHGWAFARAMLTVVEAELGSEVSKRLVKEYMKQGMDLSQAAFKSREGRVNKQAAKTVERKGRLDGTKGTGFIVRVVTQPSKMFPDQTPRVSYLSWEKSPYAGWDTTSLWGARVFAKVATAERNHKDKLGSWKDQTIEVIEVPAVFVGSKDRWHVDTDFCTP